MTDHEPADDGGAPNNERAIGGRSRGGRSRSAVGRRLANGTLALLAGGVLLGRAARMVARSRGRAAVRALAGAGLIVVGLRQRRSTDAPPTGRYAAGGNMDGPDASGSDVSFPEPPDEGRPKPNLDADEGDPRRATDEDHVEVDVSDAKLADEPGEAVGPDPEQAQPTRTEATEPEADAPDDASGESDGPDEDGRGAETGDSSEDEETTR